MGPAAAHEHRRAGTVSTNTTTITPAAACVLLKRRPLLHARALKPRRLLLLVGSLVLRLGCETLHGFDAAQTLFILLLHCTAPSLLTVRPIRTVLRPLELLVHLSVPAVVRRALQAQVFAESVELRRAW